MRFVDFRDVLKRELGSHPGGFTWKQLKERLDLPYDRPCPTWVERLVKEIGLKRTRGEGRALIWRIERK
ncbi:MAG: hypothetical protein ACYTFG_04650 [Planctomycetota bacterium]|jgi:hypothetical protein